MERVLANYENNMRPAAFQCCTSAQDGFATGFRILLIEFPFAADLQDIMDQGGFGSFGGMGGSGSSNFGQ